MQKLHYFYLWRLLLMVIFKTIVELLLGVQMYVNWMMDGLQESSIGEK